MKQATRVGVCAAIGFFLVASYGQGTIGKGTFQDLDFEHATAQASPGGFPFSPVFPGWSGSINGVSQSIAPYNLLSFLRALEIGLAAPNGPVKVVDGNYSALLISSRSQLFPQEVAISQTGVLPVGAESIQLKVAFGFGWPPFVVALGGSTIPMIPVSLNPKYILYGGAISMFAGKSETLTITVPSPSASAPDMSLIVFDDITFSSQIVPEPATFALWCMGSLALACGFRRRGS